MKLTKAIEITIQLSNFISVVALFVVNMTDECCNEVLCFPELSLSNACNAFAVSFSAEPSFTGGFVACQRVKNTKRTT